MIEKIRSYAAPGLLAAGLLLCAGRTAGAYPLLQLDIKDGVYNTATETTVATSQLFTLYAYLTPAGGTTSTELAALLNDKYYLAAALTPKVSTSQNLGSFTFNGATVHATADMVYGDPPLEGYIGGISTRDSGDLAKHDIYNTYFKEFSFNFLPAQLANAYDAQTSSANGPTLNSSGGMYYMAFQVDTSLLNPTYQVHFDLYSEITSGSAPNYDVDINKFAPFSHDAQSGSGRFLTSSAVPEPASLVLLGTGVIGLVGYYRRRRGTKK